jgi:hypothetical protein
MTASTSAGERLIDSVDQQQFADSAVLEAAVHRQAREQDHRDFRIGEAGAPRFDQPLPGNARRSKRVVPENLFRVAFLHRHPGNSNLVPDLILPGAAAEIVV